MSRQMQIVGTFGIMFSLALGIGTTSADCPSFPTGFTCKCNGDDTRWVCADWDAPGTPTEGADFTVTYTGNIPEVKFATGDLGWVLYSEALDGNGDPTGPADIGAITLHPTVSSDDFEVSIKNGAGAGAADVASIVLDDAGFTGFSNLGATTITGSVNGAITLIEDSGGSGGEVTGAVVIGFSTPLGGVTGPITIPKMSARVLIAGDYGDASANHAIDIGVIANDVSFNINGDILSDSSNTIAVDIDVLGDTDGDPDTGGSFIVGGSFTNPNATVTITDMKAIAGVPSSVRFKDDFGGILDLRG